MNHSRIGGMLWMHRLRRDVRACMCVRVQSIAATAVFQLAGERAAQACKHSLGFSISTQPARTALP